MITRDKAPQIIVKAFPDFEQSEYWKEYLDEWPEEPSTCRLMTCFSSYVYGLLKNSLVETSELKRIFDFVEDLMVYGSNEVQEGAATCFLENLINTASHGGTFKASSFIPYLGTESVKYCRAWDEFCGVKTEGLWNDPKVKFKPLFKQRDYFKHWECIVSALVFIFIVYISLF